MVIVDFYEIPIAVSLFVAASVLSLSVLASIMVKSGEKGVLPAEEISVLASGDTRYRRSPGPIAVAILIAVLMFALIAVKWVSINTGPSWHAAVTAIRLAEREAAELKWVGGQTAPAVIHEVDRTLNTAWGHLQSERYEQALGAAREAQRMLREHLGGPSASEFIRQGGPSR